MVCTLQVGDPGGVPDGVYFVYRWCVAAVAPAAPAPAAVAKLDAS